MTHIKKYFLGFFFLSKIQQLNLNDPTGKVAV